jgi:hypothetical protein
MQVDTLSDDDLLDLLARLSVELSIRMRKTSRIRDEEKRRAWLDEELSVGQWAEESKHSRTKVYAIVKREKLPHQMSRRMWLEKVK